ncbi:MAG: hypothetical protein ABI165_09295 [Bryobacteraceae bacterium]
MSTWVLVAAEAREFSGVGGFLENVKKLDWAIDFARSGARDGRQWVLVANGPGPRLAARAIGAARASTHDMDAVISTGFCGALDPALAVGDVVVGARVVDPAGREFAARIPETTRRHATGAVMSIDRVAATAAEKQELRSAGGTVVEMEASAVAGCAEEWGTPFYCVRAVTDEAGEGFGIDFNAMRDAEGRFDRSRIVRAALRKPFERIPELLRLDKSCQTAARALGEFLADCRF